MRVRVRRDGGEPPYGRPWNGEIRCHGLRWKLPHLCVTGEMRGRELGSDDNKGEGQRSPEREISDLAQSCSSMLRDTAPALRVRGSVDRLAVFDARLSDVHLTGDGDICLLPPFGDAKARKAGQREMCHQEP
jgi:hypothetical protein